MTYDTIIIGGGIAGTSAAYNLARSGVRTLLIDRHDAGRATDAGAGILSFETLGLGGGRLWFDFAMQCGSHYRQLIEQLQEEQGSDTGYAVVGEMIVAVDDDEISAFEAQRRLISAQQEAFGVPSADDFRALTRAEARELFPPLALVQRALLIRSSARVDGRLLTSAMRQAAEAKGLTIKQASVERLVIENGAVTGVVADGETISADKVIIAGGAWSRTFGDQLGLRIPVYPLRGQIIHLSLPGTDTSRWPVVHAFHGHYSVSWPDSRVAVGATRESVGFNPQPTAAGVREVLDEALRVAPGLAEAELKEIRVGLRPACEDGRPVIGPVPGVENVYVATAFAAIGLQLGPFSGKLAADWAQAIQPSVDTSLFSPERFQRQD
jgi:D-amino-acid dehydrogenase